MSHSFNPIIRPATPTDVASMVALSDKKRRAYEQAQPQFWHRAEKANAVLLLFFRNFRRIRKARLSKYTWTKI